MTVSEWRENTSLKDQEVFVTKLYTWLEGYTDEVIRFVITEKLEEIINNPMALMLIDELAKRREDERRSAIRDLVFTLGHEDECKKYQRFDVLTHSNSYANVLRDLYISGFRSEK